MFKHKDHKHEFADQARECEKLGHPATPPPLSGMMGLHSECRGGVCRTIDELCSRHSMQYQTRWGRASNE